MEVILIVVVLIVCVLHKSKTSAILISTFHIPVFFWKKTVWMKLKTRIDVCQVCRIILYEHWTKIFFTKVTNVIEYNIQYQLHSTGVNFVDKFLEVCICRFVSGINLCKVHGVISVIVQTRTVFYNRSNPDCSKTKSLDVVELFNKSFKVTAPCRIIFWSIRIFIPTMNVV